MKKLKENKLLRNELNNILLYSDSGYMLTNNYIVPYFNKIFSFKINSPIKYTDVILLYKSNWVSNPGNIGLSKYLHFITKNKQHYYIVIDLINNCDDDSLKNFTDIILEKNKDVLIGKTNENKKIIFDKYNIKIK